MAKLSSKLLTFLLSFAMIFTSMGWLGTIEVNAAEGDTVLIVKLVDAENAGIAGITPALIYHGTQGGKDDIFDGESDLDGLVQFELTGDVAYADEDYPEEYYTIEMPEGCGYTSNPVKVVIKVGETDEFYVDTVGGEGYSSEEPYPITLTKEGSANPDPEDPDSEDPEPEVLDFVSMSDDDWATYGIAYGDIADDDFILDVREDVNWKAGHLPGATHVDVSVVKPKVELGSDVAKKLESAYAAAGDKRIVIVCNAGKGLARRAMEYFNQAEKDLNNITYLIGGNTVIPDKDKIASAPDTVVERTLGKQKSTNMTTVIDMTKYDKGKVVRVWVPVPQTEDYQEITNVKFTAKTATEDSGFKTRDGNKMLYLEWDADADPAGRIATLKFNASRYEAGHDELIAYDDSDFEWPEEVAPYLTKESEYVKWDNDIVKEYAEEAVGDSVGTLAKARAIYDWVIANLERIDDGELLWGVDDSDASTPYKEEGYKVEGCGYGDTVEILSDLKAYGRAGGHCTDINSTFVALCRAAGIPAREMFGIRMNADATGGQHCWAEFYLPGTGWVFADPADVLKAIKNNRTGMTPSQVEAERRKPENKEKAEYFWGRVDENRIVLSRGRDVIFEPAQSWGKCNTFGYPAAEVDGERLADFTDAKKFVYTITSGDVSEPVDYTKLRTEDKDAWEAAGIAYGDITEDDFILDVRPDARWNEGHLLGSVHVNVDVSDTTQVDDGYVVEKSALAKELDKAYKSSGEKRIVVICNGGQTLAARALQYYNDKNFYGNGVDKNKLTYLIGGNTKIPAEDKVVAAPDTTVARTLGKTKARMMTTVIDMSKYEKGKVVRVWVPIPQTEDYQTVSDVTFRAKTAKTAEITTEDTNGNKMLYLEWDADAEPADRIATLKFNASRYEAGHDDLVVYDDSEFVWPEDVEPYITKESAYVKWDDPIVRKYTEEAVGNKIGTYAKARAIYDWITANLERIDDKETLVNAKGASKTFKVEGCGYGDTVQILTDYEEFGRAGGHCTDLNSTFVAMCRAAGIPAREMFGIRMNDDATGGQHCWAEFYLPGTGWVFADPGDVLKAVKGKNKEMTVEQVKAAKESTEAAENLAYFWGRVDENRIVLSRGRDVVFNPPQKWGKCNTFGYPAAEVDGERLPDFTDAKNFVYTISCSEAKDAIDYTKVQAAGAAAWAEAGIPYGDITEDDFILDVRPDAKWEAGHLKGATHVNVALTDETQVKDGYVVEGSDLAKALDKACRKAGDKRVVVICNKGQTLAARALEYFNKEYYFGFGVDKDKITYLIGGNDEGVPEGVNIIPVNYVKLQAASDAAWDEAGIDFADINKNDFILDVRPDARWDEGHLPGATHVNVALTDETQVKDGYVVEESDLAKALNDAYEKADGKKIVVICNQGKTLAARALQYLNDQYYYGAGVEKDELTYLIGGNTRIPVEAKVKDRTLGAKKSEMMTTVIDMSKYEKGKVIKVWVPIPQTEDYQTVSDVIFNAETAKTAEITTENENGNKMLYLEWDAGAEPAGRVATLKFYASRYEAGHDDLVSVELPENYEYPEDVAPYVTKESAYVKWNDPIVKKYTEEAVGNKTDSLEKARAIYDWITANLERIDDNETLVNAKGASKTFKVEGCGYGDTVQILTDYEEFGRAGGHCTDLNSTFVAMCRAAGIPAREMFGIRLKADATGGQHCWAEFYLPGTGWVFADPGDVLKAIKSKTGMTVDEVAAAKDGDTFTEKLAYFWGRVDEERIVLSRGRDIVFNPPQKWGKCNTFGYPAAEVDGERLPDFTDAKNFVYTISCGEVDQIIDDAVEKEAGASTAANDANDAIENNTANADQIIDGAITVVEVAAEAAVAAQAAAQAAYDAAVQEYGEGSEQAEAAQEAVEATGKLVASTKTSKASVMTSSAKAASKKAAAAQAAANSAAKGSADAVSKAQAALNAANSAAEKAKAADEAAKAALEAAKATGDENLIEAAEKVAETASKELTEANNSVKKATDSVAAAKSNKASADAAAAAAAAAEKSKIDNNGVLDNSLPKVSIKSPKKGKKSFTAKWKKLSKSKQKKIKGIEIEYSTTKNFSSANKFKKAGKTKTSVKVKKLKAKKTYYVRAHTYVVKNGVKYVSPWSKVKKVKVK